MGKFKYFAYGSNMLNERLQQRCSTARPVGTAMARDFQLKFCKLSQDGSGKATLVHKQGMNQYGVLFEIEMSQLKDLDSAEGRGLGYERDNNFAVISCDSGLETQAVTYLAENPGFGLRPFDWYLALVAAGAEQHRLPRELIASLKCTPYACDGHVSRKTRTIAREVLAKHGIEDPVAFLSSGSPWIRTKATLSRITPMDFESGLTV